MLDDRACVLCTEAQLAWLMVSTSALCCIKYARQGKLMLVLLLSLMLGNNRALDAQRTGETKGLRCVPVTFGPARVCCVLRRNWRDLR